MLNSQGSGVGAIDLHGINSWWRVVWVFMRLSRVLVGSGVYESFLFSHIWYMGHTSKAVCESSLFFYDPTLNIEKKRRFAAPLFSVHK